jgi:hypothetical protein
MPLVRCKEHPPENDRAARPYTAFALPIGHPDTAAICGRRDCQNPGYVWLTRSEQAQHKKGLRVFAARGGTTKIKVSNRLFKNGAKSGRVAHMKTRTKSQVATRRGAGRAKSNGPREMPNRLR